MAMDRFPSNILDFIKKYRKKVKEILGIEGPEYSPEDVSNEDVDALFDGGGGEGSSSSGSTPSPQQDGVHFVDFDAYESQVGDSGTVNLIGVTFAEILANPESFNYYDDHGNELMIQTTEDVGADYVDLAFKDDGYTGQFNGGMHITESSWTWVY